MVRVRYLGGFCRIFGREYHTSRGWYEVNESVLKKVRNAPNWEVEGAEPVVEEVEVVEETSDDTDLESLSKKELQAMCDELGISYRKLDSKSVLLSSLQSVDITEEE
jgi:hypothetical protein